MLVNLLLQDGRANYMEGVMRELRILTGGTELTFSDCAIPRHCSQLPRLA